MDQTGQVVGKFPGAEDTLCLTRSMIKPIQAIGILSHQRVKELSSQQLALIASSHSATPAHVAGVESILALAGVSQTALGCGGAWPLDTAHRHHLIKTDGCQSAVFHNCSGKHAGMLLACHWYGWPQDTYLKPDHPLQQLIVNTLTEMSGGADLTVCVDGCGAPTFGLPMLALGQVFARLSAEDRWHAVLEAMVEHPELVGDKQRIDTRLMQVSQGQLIAKVGADGVMAVINRQRHHGLVLKVWDGRTDIRDRYVIGVLENLGWLTSSDAQALWQEPAFALVRTNNSGAPVGDYRLHYPWV